MAPDAVPDAMPPLERLLNLVALLLETDRPLTFDEIRETLEAYGSENASSAKRKFERDKDILREFGVPLVMADTDVWGTEQGYIIPKDEYYLPEIDFRPEEIAALFVAAQGGTGAAAAEQGVRKLLYGADGGVLVGLQGGPLVAGSDRGGDVLAAADAASAKRRVRFGYRDSHGAVSDREIDAYGLVFRGGHWYLVGYDHEREGVRAFRLSRFTSPLADMGEGGGPPAGFDAAAHVDSGPWVPSGEDSALVAFETAAAVLARSAFPLAVEQPELSDGRNVLSIPAADPGSLAALIIQYGPDAQVLEPAELREEVIRRLKEVLDA